MMHRLPLAAAAAAALLAASTSAQTATTVPLAPTKDSTLYEEGGTVANGAGEYVFAGLTLGFTKRRTVIEFDVAAAVPAGARILGATLQMNVSRSLDSNPLPVALHRVLESWSEGATNAPGEEGGGAFALNGDVTWIHRDKPNLLWTTPGGDFAAAPSAVAITQISGPATWQATPAMLADLQGWLDDPSTNFGWLLKTDELVPMAVRRFDSRQNPTVANRPQLSITYAVPGQWAAVGPGCGAPAPSLSVSGSLAAGGNVVLALQSNPNLLGANFLSLGAAAAPFPLAAGCSLYLPPLGVSTPGLAVTDPAGLITNTIPVPVSPSFTGLLLSGQGGLLDPAQPAGFALSNAITLIVN